MAPPRHCERSEAIQTCFGQRRKPGLLRRWALRNDGGWDHKKSAGSSASGGSFLFDVAAPYAFMFAFTASAVIGSERMRAPQALKMALPSAGAITVAAGSPTPVAFSPLAMTLTATSGTWLILSGV